MRLVTCTDVGMVRGHNEDAVMGTHFDFGQGTKGVSCHLGIVADGMGGAAAGEVASALTVETVSREVYLSFLEALLNPDQNYVNPRRLLYHAVECANERVWRAAREHPGFFGMGSTVDTLLTCQGRLFVSHVGDSRVYRVRGGHLTQLTEDHSFVNELVKEGRLTPDEARTHPRKNVITRAIGSRPRVRVDSLTGRLDSGDLYLLCSDGLSGMLEDDELHSVLQLWHGGKNGGSPLEEIAQELIERANRAGGHDNISVCLMGIEDRDIPAPRMEQVALDPGAVLLWDEAAQLDIQDSSFIPVEEE